MQRKYPELSHLSFNQEIDLIILDLKSFHEKIITVDDIKDFEIEFKKY